MAGAMADTSSKVHDDGPSSAEPATKPATPAELDALFFETIGAPEGRRDPYDRYRRLREAAPVHRTSVGFFVCTGYEECYTALRDPRLGKGEGGREEQIRARFGRLEVFPRLLELVTERRSLLFLNPPDHTRLRGLVSQAFTPRRVEQLRPEIAAVVDELCDAIPAGEVVDAMEALAYRLPIAVISKMLGVPASDWPRFREVMGRATLLLEPVISDDEVEPALEAQLELERYFGELVASRRGALGDDLLSALIGLEEGTDKLTEVELIATVILLFGAGFETTTNLIGNGLLALLRHPQEMARLRSDLALESAATGRRGGTRTRDRAAMRLAVDEMLRYDTPVQFDGRHAFADLVLGGVTIPAGSEVVTVLGAANRDPARFSDPDRLDLRRDEGPSMSFAGGIHFCLGAALARAEGQIVFERLLERFSSIELATDSPTYKNRITLRGLSELPVVLSN